MIHNNKKRTVKIKMNFIIEKDFNIYRHFIFTESGFKVYNFKFVSINPTCLHLHLLHWMWSFSSYFSSLVVVSVRMSLLAVCMFFYFIFMCVYVCDAHACPQWDLFPWVIIKCVFQIAQEPAKTVTNSSPAFHFLIL